MYLSDLTDPVVRYVFDGALQSVLEFDLHTTPPSSHRLAILWSLSRNRRVLPILVALYHRDPQALAKIAAVRESGHVLHLYCTDQAEHVTRALIRAARCALYRDTWTVHPVPEIVPTKDGRVNVPALPADHPLLLPAKTYQLGVRRGGAS